MVSVKFEWRNLNFEEPTNINDLSPEANSIIRKIITDFKKNSGLKPTEFRTFIILILLTIVFLLWILNLCIIEFNILIFFISLGLCIFTILFSFFIAKCKRTKLYKINKYFEEMKEKYNEMLRPYDLEVFNNLRRECNDIRVNRENGKQNRLRYFVRGNIEFKTKRDSELNFYINISNFDQNHDRINSYTIPDNFQGQNNNYDIPNDRSFEGLNYPQNLNVAYGVPINLNDNKNNIMPSIENRYIPKI